MNVEEIADKLLTLKDKADHDPQVQDYLSKAELPENLEYVKPEQTGRRGGYFRRRPARDSQKQVEHRLRFSRVAYDHFGVRGTSALSDGRRISTAARAIGNQLRGTGSIKDPAEKERKRLIQILEPEETTTRRVQVARRVQAAWI